VSAEEEELEGSHVGVAIGALRDKSQEECYLTRSWPGVGMYVLSGWEEGRVVGGTSRRGIGTKGGGRQAVNLKSIER